jgi:hypothetical protein
LPEERAVVVSKEGIEVKLIIGVTEAYVNGEKVSLDVPAEIVNARTVVPLRFISEAFGAAVEWEGETKSVVIFEEEQTESPSTNESVGEITAGLF